MQRSRRLFREGVKRIGELDNVYPSFAKEGWTRPKEKCCEASLVERTGWLFQASA